MPEQIREPLEALERRTSSKPPTSIVRIIGSGVITGAADDDPSAIAGLDHSGGDFPRGGVSGRKLASMNVATSSVFSG